MASWREIHEIQDDPDRARFLAGLQLKYSLDGLTEWEANFLTDMVERTEAERLTPRQAETLLEIRDKVDTVSTVGTFSVMSLVRQCFEARDDLDEDTAEWLEEIYAEGCDRIRKNQARRLLGCARQLYLIEDYIEL